MFSNTIQRNPLSIALVCTAALLALWLPALILPIVPGTLRPSFMMPLQQWAIETLHFQGRAGIWASFVITSASACLLFAANRKHLFAAGQEQHLLLLFALISSATPCSQQFSGSHPAAFLILLSVYHLFNAIQVTKAISSLFLSSFFATLAGLFYLPSAIAVVALFIGIVVSKPFEWRDWVAYFTGIATPWFYILSYHNLRYGSCAGFLKTLTGNIPAPTMFEFAFSKPETLLFVLLALLVLCTLFPLKPVGHLVKVKNTRMRQVLKCLLLLLLVLVLLFSSAQPGMMPLIAIPLSILAADYYDHIRRKKLFNLLLCLLCLAIAGIRIL